MTAPKASRHSAAVIRIRCSSGGATRRLPARPGVRRRCRVGPPPREADAAARRRRRPSARLHEPRGSARRGPRSPGTGRSWRRRARAGPSRRRGGRGGPRRSRVLEVAASVHRHACRAQGALRGRPPPRRSGRRRGSARPPAAPSGEKSWLLPRPPAMRCTPPANAAQRHQRAGDVRGLGVVDAGHAVTGGDQLEPVRDAGEVRRPAATASGSIPRARHDRGGGHRVEHGCARRAARSRRRDAAARSSHHR